MTLAPCYFVDMDAIEINLKEPQSQVFLFDLLKTNNITTIFGAKFAIDVEAKICTVPALVQLCQYLLMINEQVASYGGNQSAMSFAHLAQVSS